MKALFYQLGKGKSKKDPSEAIPYTQQDKYHKNSEQITFYQGDQRPTLTYGSASWDQAAKLHSEN